jgi:hypothetical protein
MNFLTNDNLLSLANAIGSIGTACLKIKKVLKEAHNRANETESQSDVSMCDHHSDVSTICEGEQVEQVQEPSILEEDFEEQAEQYLLTRMRWNKLDGKRFFTEMIRGRVRANRMKHCWIHVGGSFEDKQNWKRTSSEKIEKVYYDIREAWHGIVERIENYDRRPELIRQSKWARRSQVIDADFPPLLFSRKGWKSDLVNRHAELPRFK